MAATLRAAGGDLLRSLTLFDIYRGAPLAAGEKSLAWRLDIRADERRSARTRSTQLVARLVDAVTAAHGGRLRA